MRSEEMMNNERWILKINGQDPIAEETEEYRINGSF